MTLAVNSEKGKETVIKEKKMLRYVSDCLNIKIKITSKDGASSYDGFITDFIDDSKPTGVFESKNREATLEQFEEWGSWLITFEKLEKCRAKAKKYGVPLYGFLGIEYSNVVMYWKITDCEGNYIFDFEHKPTWTQETVNGGWVLRDNAFLPLKYGHFVQPNQKLL